MPASQVAPHLALAASTGAGAFADIQAGIEAQNFRDHVKDAAAVVLGRVTGLQKAAPAAFSEHDPDWWIATIDAYQVVRGPGAEARHDRGPLPEQPRRAVAQLAEAEGRTGRALRPPCQRPLGPVAGEVPAPPSRRPPAGAERRCPHERKEPMSIRVVNMIPASLSGETSQDSEPNIAVNPQNTKAIVGTAFTPAPTGGSFAPIYISSDGGNTWALRMVVPGNGFVGTSDITVAFADTGGHLYAGILNGSTINFQILRTANYASRQPDDGAAHPRERGSAVGRRRDREGEDRVARPRVHRQQQLRHLAEDRDGRPLAERRERCGSVRVRTASDRARCREPAGRSADASRHPSGRDDLRRVRAVEERLGRSRPEHRHRHDPRRQLGQRRDAVPGARSGREGGRAEPLHPLERDHGPGAARRRPLRRRRPEPLRHGVDRLVRPRRRRHRHRLDAARTPLDGSRCDVVGRPPHDHEREEPVARGQLEQRARAALPGVHRIALGDEARADVQRLVDRRVDDRAAHGAVQRCRPGRSSRTSATTCG